MPSSIRVDQNVPMTTRDGVTLRSDVYRPDDGEPHPAVLIRTPYNKQRKEGAYITPMQLARADYACVVQDTRGRFASEGVYVSMGPEGEDGYDAVEWVAAQPWCNGNVGMAGGSYVGRTQWEAAEQAPPSLKAIAPAIALTGLIGDFERYGVIRFEAAVSWFLAMVPDIIDRLESGGHDVAEAQRMAAQARANLDEVLLYLPFNEAPHFDFDGVREEFRRRASDELPAGVVDEATLRFDFSRMNVAVLHVGGWYDIYVDGLFEAYKRMKQDAPEAVRDRQHLICGPWTHGAESPYLGALHFGPAAASAAALVPEQHIRFFDRYLRGSDVEIPAVRYFVMGENRWHNADTWPLPEARAERFFFSSGGDAGRSVAGGCLQGEAPSQDPPDVYSYDPHDPTPTQGGRTLPGGKLTPGPLDQRDVEARGDVVSYSTGPLERPVEVSGPVRVHLFASSSAVDTDFMAKLVDVYPSGAAFNVAEGVVRARYRNGLFALQLLSPGEIVEYTIELATVSNSFLEGHRIRVDIASANFPYIDRNMNTGNAFGVDAIGEVATQTIFHDAGRASYVELPMLPAE